MRVRGIRGRDLALAALVSLAASDAAAQAPDDLWIPGAEPGRGLRLLQAYECGVCHTIENVPGAHGIVGPRLERFAERTMLAGNMANVPRNLVAWLMDPPAIDPTTAMPDMGVSEAEARDIAAFLYTLGGAAAARAYQPEAASPDGAGQAPDAQPPAATPGDGTAGVSIDRAMEILSSQPPRPSGPGAAAD